MIDGQIPRYRGREDPDKTIREIPSQTPVHIRRIWLDLLRLVLNILLQCLHRLNQPIDRAGLRATLYEHPSPALKHPPNKYLRGRATVDRPSSSRVHPPESLQEHSLPTPNTSYAFSVINDTQNSLRTTQYALRNTQYALRNTQSLRCFEQIKPSILAREP